MAHIILAPHLDDEVIGCFSVLSKADQIVYFTKDYRADNLPDDRYVFVDEFNFRNLKKEDTIYLPSKYDYHPLHKKVRNVHGAQNCNKMFYSVEMNVPWLEEEKEPKIKKELFDKLYPKELMNNDKYWLFCSIKPFDDIIFASIKFDFEEMHSWPNAPADVGFLRNMHRHRFYCQVNIQQFHNDRNLEYFLLQRQITALASDIEWHDTMSCEMFSLELKNIIQADYPDRLVEVLLFEDNENGAIIR